MKRENYIADKDVEGFINFLVDDIQGNGKALDHKLNIRDTRVPKDYKNPRSINSLKEAFESYFWASKGFDETSLLLVPLRLSLFEAYYSKNKANLLAAAGGVFDWGLTANASAWNKKWATSRKDFVSSIAKALHELSSSEPKPEVFDDDRCRMNSGFTKVYALLHPGSIIYDGRVGAALGLLVIHFLNGKGESKLPASLAFPWAPGVGKANRNPSSNNFQFPTIQSLGPKGHATWNIKANWIINEVINKCVGSATWLTGEPVRQLEAALFMIGYEIPTKSVAGPAKTSASASSVLYVPRGSLIEALNGSFDVNHLIEHMRNSGLEYLIQGQQACSYADHTKKKSLDYWIRGRCAAKRDQKQADNRVITQLVNTGFFREDAKLDCPETGHKCKGVVLVPE